MNMYKSKLFSKTVILHKNNDDIKYSICTVVSDAYLEFLYFFVKSALKSCENLEKIYVLYTGNSFPKDELYANSKLEIVNHHMKIDTKNIWDDGWIANVDLKTQFLKKLAIESVTPIFLIDVDSYFVTNFIDTIDMKKDLTVCKRNVASMDKNHIASFVGLINPKKCIPFLDSWINNLNNIKKIPRETLALCLTISELDKSTKIQELSDDIISCVHIDPPLKYARILHFKGRSVGDAKKLIGDRLERLKKVI